MEEKKIGFGLVKDSQYGGNGRMGMAEAYVNPPDSRVYKVSFIWIVDGEGEIPFYCENSWHFFYDDDFVTEISKRDKCCIETWFRRYKMQQLGYDELRYEKNLGFDNLNCEKYL